MRLGKKGHDALKTKAHFASALVDLRAQRNTKVIFLLPLRSFMPLDDAMSRLLRELTERIAKEQDPEKLQELVLGINGLLDAVEAQLAKLEGSGDSSDS